MDGEADDSGREEGYHQGQGQPLPDRIPRKLSEQVPQELSEIHDDRKDGAELNHNLKAGGLFAREIQGISGENQMAGGRDRKEFGETFDNAEDDNGPDRHARRSIIRNRGEDCQGESREKRFFVDKILRFE